MKPDPLAVIRIKELRLKVVIGTRPHERSSAQEIMADISFEYDASLAASSDALGHAVDYAAMHTAIVQRTGATSFLLLERLAGFVLDIIMEETRIVNASVTLEKPGVLDGAKAVFVTMSARRSGQQVTAPTRCC